LIALGEAAIDGASSSAVLEVARGGETLICTRLISSGYRDIYVSNIDSLFDNTLAWRSCKGRRYAVWYMVWDMVNTKRLLNSHKGINTRQQAGSKIGERGERLPDIRGVEEGAIATGPVRRGDGAYLLFAFLADSGISI